MENGFRSEQSPCFFSMVQEGSAEEEASSGTLSGCTVRVSFAAESRGADVLPNIMERLTASFRCAAKP
jgi:hypothetical protein